MRRRSWRDLFVVHTKSIELDKSTIDLVAENLIPAGYSIWGYDDWDWEKRRNQGPSWQDDLMRNGFLLDPIRAIEGNPPPAPPEVDRSRIDGLISHSRAVLFLNPSRGDLTSGMREELYSLRRDRSKFYREDPVPVALWCAFETNLREPFPLGFGDGRDIVADWKAEIHAKVVDGQVSRETIVHISILIARLLIEQRLAHKLKKNAAHNRESIRLLMSDFDCTPDEELSRARNVLRFAHTIRGSGIELDQIVSDFEDFIDTIDVNELNDGH